MQQKQKLVSFFLHDAHDSSKGSYGDANANALFGVREHLNDYLQDGWKVTNVSVLGGVGGCLSGWVIASSRKITILKWTDGMN